VVALSSLAGERNKGELQGGEESWKITLNININHFFSLESQNGPQAPYALGKIFSKCLKVPNSNLKLLQMVLGIFVLRP
jgi:hypothetical protein